MIARGLTAAQSAALDFIRTYISQRGYSPNYDEIAQAIGLKSKSAVSRIVTALVDRGYIVNAPGPGRARSIRLMEQGADDEALAILTQREEEQYRRAHLAEQKVLDKDKTIAALSREIVRLRDRALRLEERMQNMSLRHVASLMERRTPKGDANV
jgi:SOS-response transcriptional repressor LexA